uniref:Dachshund family transcription factor 1 n=1 Tax=Xenopus tropicalis TaxID=8364 RepID=A0A6I8R0G2_XENTR
MAVPAALIPPTQLVTPQAAISSSASSSSSSTNSSSSATNSPSPSIAPSSSGQSLYRPEPIAATPVTPSSLSSPAPNLTASNSSSQGAAGTGGGGSNGILTNCSSSSLSPSLTTTNSSSSHHNNSIIPSTPATSTSTTSTSSNSSSSSAPTSNLPGKPVYSTPSPVENIPQNNECRMVDLRGAKVASFTVDGSELICLPQAFDLFLKHLVGGLHTVYTKLKRLEITPVVCNVEQVRILRGLGAIQPGVNRCKLISRKDFETLYNDCTNASSRPGRPPKRTQSVTSPDNPHIMPHTVPGLMSPGMIPPTGSSDGSWDKEKLQSLPTQGSQTSLSHPNLPGQHSLSVTHPLNSLQQNHLLPNGLELPFMMMPHPLIPVSLPPASVTMAMSQMNHLSTIANMAAAAQVHSTPSRVETSVIKERVPDSPSPAPSLEDGRRPVSHPSSHRSSSVSSSPARTESSSDRIPVHQNGISINQMLMGLSPNIIPGPKEGDLAGHEVGHEAKRMHMEKGEDSLIHDDNRIVALSTEVSDSFKLHYRGFPWARLELQSAIESYRRLPKSCTEGSKSERFSCILRSFDETPLSTPTARDSFDKLSLSGHGQHLPPGYPSPFLFPDGLSSIETLLTNIQGLLKVAIDNARAQEKQVQMEKTELKMELFRERELRETLEKQLAVEQKNRAIIQKRLKKEKKAKRKLQEALEFETKRREQAEQALKQAASSEGLRVLNESLTPDLETDRNGARTDAERTIQDGRLYLKSSVMY